MTVAESEVALTPRQREVVRLLLDGRDVRQIAVILRCTPATVRKHIEQIAGRLPGPQPPMRRILVYGPAILSEAG